MLMAALTVRPEWADEGCGLLPTLKGVFRHFLSVPLNEADTVLIFNLLLHSSVYLNVSSTWKNIAHLTQLWCSVTAPSGEFLEPQQGLILLARGQHSLGIRS